MIDDAPRSEHDVYPADRSEAWHAWKETDDGRKVPRAPWLNPDWPDKFVSAQNADVWTDRDTAAKWCEHLSGYGLALNIRDREDHPDEDLVLIDYDDARDPDTERIHPTVCEHIERADSYADISTSGTGIHILLRGELPEDVKAIEAALPDHSEFPDAEIEVYDSGRFVAMTGEHIRATPRETTAAQGFVDDLADEYATVAEGTPDELVRDPENSRAELADVETTTEIQKVFDAIQHTGPRDVRLRSTVTHERSNGSKSLDPAYRDSESGTGLAEVDGGWIERKGLHGLDALQMIALEDRIINRPDQYPEGEEFWQAVEALRERGAHIPEYDPPADWGEGIHSVEQCARPVYNPEEFDREQRWSELQGDRYEAFLDSSGPHVWADPPGVGKSTNAERAAAQRDRPYFAGFDKHEKGREAISDDATPDEQYHLKGAEQPREDCCMDATAAAEGNETPHCPEHGHPSDWPRMCPIYERTQEDLLRQRFEALVGPLGTLGTHLKLGLFDEDDHPWHGTHARWSDQFDHLLDDEGQPLAERVVGVHEYQLLKSATEDRDVIVDESPRTLTTEQRVDVDDLLRAQARLKQLAEVHRNDDDSALSDNLAALATFADDLAHTIACDDTAAFAEIDTPGVQPVAFDRPVDPDDLPAEVAPEEVKRTTWREYQGVNSEHYVEHDRYVAPTEVYDEPLAQVKIAYNEGLVSRIQQTDDELPTALFCIDALFAAAGKAGLPTADVRRAVAVPPVLDDCPWCGSALDAENGARVCASDECDWDERENTITQQGGEKARASAWLDDNPADLDTGEHPALVFGRLPAVDNLPDDPLILDATATPEKIAGLYGASMNEVDIRGDGHLDLDGRLNVTQVLDGQYHANTIRQSETARERIQNVIKIAIDTHDKPLFGIRRDLISLFEFVGTEGEDYEMLVYGGARGLNRTECDAVVCIGAPHPDMNDVQRQAELLAMDHDDLCAGGKEYSTRRNAPNPPVYRKLLFEDEYGDGLAVPTKAYSGVAGALFREAREKELEQFVHRIRPLLVGDADSAKDAYLLTNVPTNLPVDEVCRFEELADDLSALFPVPERAIELLGHGRDVLVGDGPGGFRDGALVEKHDDGTLANKVAGWHQLAQLNGMDVTERTVRNWIDALESVGLLTAENYEQRAGVSYTAEISTLKSALQVLSSNAGFEVAAVRRLADKIRESDGALEWLAWAEGVFDLSGDRCGWGPPPNSPG
ncbi:hypothetical protein [Halococcus thailandensis]|uniref:DNA primase/polymerase bifunctional N-terminal domain-containing protein n=1 Tax=Halococcus thailandensis JCM 13552 TaxID=1227457 RepID=M0NBL5_9EURY|nr:hypothetical protein [Halococcus thailandensis]EMA55367.1 hypothetical protein C451_05373 [Halococcus thailandensis JCM 13552]